MTKKTTIVENIHQKLNIIETSTMIDDAHTLLRLSPSLHSGIGIQTYEVADS